MSTNVDPRLNWEETFVAGKYQRTLELLNKVSPDQRQDPWKHNVYITEYCAQNCSEQDFLDRLSALEVSDDKIENQAVLMYNKAVILYKMKRFRSSEEICQKVWSEGQQILNSRLLGPLGLLLIHLAFLARNFSKGLKIYDQLSAILRRESVDEQIGETPDIHSQLQLYKARLQSLSDSPGDSVPDLQSLLKQYDQHQKSQNISPAWQRMNVNALTLLAQVECRRENFSKAIDQLSQCSDSHQLNTTMVSNYNNLACVHYNYGNPGLAKFYLIRTLTCFEDMGYSTINEHRVKTLYNLGLCFLHHDSDFESAMMCFEETRPLYYNRPKLWLRMAECCIQNHHKLLEKRQKETCQSSLIRDDCSGALCGRRLMLPLPKRTLLDGLADSPDEPPANLSMSSALVYLKNAHSLLESDQKSNLYFHVLICLSYVCLCKNCPNEAERYCRELLRSGSPSSHFKIIAKNYLAEALCLLGRSQEAVQHLDLSSEIVDSDDKVCCSFTNLAAVYILEKKTQEANLCLQAAISCNPTYYPALKLLAYIYLTSGKVDEAISLLSKQRPYPSSAV